MRRGPTDGRRALLRRRLAGAGLALLCVTPWSLPGPAGAADAPPTPPSVQPTTAPVTTADLQPEPDLDRLRTQLTAAEEQVRAATADAQAAAGRAVGAQIARTSALQAAEAARLALRDEVRQSLTDGPLATVPSWAVAPDVGSVGLLGEIRTRSVHKRADQAAVVRRASDQLDAATRTLDAARDAAIRDAGEAVLAADRARRLMDAAQRISAANDVVRSQLEAQRRALDALNDALVRSLAPVQRPAAEAAAPSSPGRAPRPEAVDTFPDGTKPDASASAQAAVLRILEATPLGQVPAGYATTGQVFQGEASWYGPGFVGSPTSTGVPYDPEKLTCAMLMVPLGSVVRVTSESGASVVLLVNDHGPYVGDRILDVSVRANRILSLNLGQVRVEVLRRVG